MILIMSEYNQAEIENIFIKTYETPPVSEEIPEPQIEKPQAKQQKPKRKLTEKQKEALAKGRAKAKERREAEKMKSSQELKKEQRDKKKELKKEQAKQTQANTKSKLQEDKEAQLLTDWETKKRQALGVMPCVDSYNTMKAYLDTLSKEDILDKSKLKGKLAYMVNYLNKKM